jgi:hypothetical protein
MVKIGTPGISSAHLPWAGKATGADRDGQRMCDKNGIVWRALAIEGGPWR